MNSQLLIIRAKKIGLRLTDIREKFRFSVEDIAGALGISPEEVLQAEQGMTCFSLPQLEALSSLYDLPLERLLNWETKGRPVSEDQKDFLKKSTALHDHILAARLKKARLTQQVSLESLAEYCGLSSKEYSEYENAERPVPYTVLETISKVLNLDTVSILATKTPIPQTKPAEAVQGPTKLSHLPETLQDFVNKPINQPYIELARKLSEFDVNRLRKIAESLLEITY